MAKNLEITNIDIGVGPSPHRGFGDMRNLDITSKPGVVRINNVLEKVSASTVTDLIMWTVRNPQNSLEIWALGNTQRVYKSSDNGASWSYVSGNGGGSGQGLTIYKDYLIVARNATLDVYGPLSGSPTWFNDWQAIDADAVIHPMINSLNDGLVYGGAGRYIFSIDEVADETFSPSDSTTYNFVQHAGDLALPTGYRVTCLTELGEKVLIGTRVGYNLTDFKIATIFPWDRSSLTFDTPVELNENGVNAMITVNNITYILGGVAGRIFTTNGVQATQIAQIPPSIVNLEGGKFLTIYPNCMMNYKGKIYFGIGCNTLSGGIGVWSLNPTGQGNILNYEHTISTGNDGTSTGMDIASLLPVTRDTFLAGWRDSSTYGIDRINNTSRYTGYTAYFESPFFNVGTNKMKQVYQQIEFLLARALIAGHGIRLKYRTRLSDSFTTIGTYTFEDLGSIVSHNTVPGIPACEFIQIRGELTTVNNGTNTTPELKTILLN